MREQPSSEPIDSYQQALSDGGYLPTPPIGGGFLVLNKSQINNWDLVCLIRRVYPETRIIAQQPLQNIPYRW